MTASEISDQVGVSQPAITRFVTNVLKYPGFSSFIKDIQNIIRHEITGIDRYQIASNQFKSDVDLIINQEIESLKNILTSTSEAKLTQIANQIISTQSIFILGFRTGAPIAEYFYFFLRKIHPDVRICRNGGSDVYDVLHRLDRENTLIVIFVFPRYPSEMIEVIKYLKQEKLSFMVISDSYSLQMKSVCKVDIITPVIMNTLFDSYTSTFCLLNILLDIIGRIHFQQTKEMLKNVEEMYRKNNIFYTDG
jgi:DNA-binding MurR/RpiR family transcriptional regulator